jgi:hypothetical protein
MKTIKITITGEPLVVDYCNTDLDFSDNYYTQVGWTSVSGVFVNDNPENVIKKKGKYFITSELWHTLLSPDGDHPLPVELHMRTFAKTSFNYSIEIPDDQDFDIKKLQLIKSNYELEVFPYFIDAHSIVYDGKEFTTKDDEDYCIGGRSYDEETVYKFID